MDNSVFNLVIIKYPEEERTIIQDGNIILKKVADAYFSIYGSLQPYYDHSATIYLNDNNDFHFSMEQSLYEGSWDEDYITNDDFEKIKDMILKVYREIL